MAKNPFVDMNEPDDMMKKGKRGGKRKGRKGKRKSKRY